MTEISWSYCCFRCRISVELAFSSGSLTMREVQCYLALKDIEKGRLEQEYISAETVDKILKLTQQ